MRERSEIVLADLIALRAETRPDLDVLTFERWSLGAGAGPDEVRTYADLHEHAQRIAAMLVRVGMARGDRFGLMMRNHPAFVETLIAASTTGCVAVPIDPRTRGEKLAFTLRNAGCRMVVCADYCYPQVCAVRPSLPELRWVFTLATGEAPEPVPLAGSASLDEVLAWPAGATVDVRLAGPDDPLQIIYTSGTTGDPKGVVFPNGRWGACSSATGPTSGRTPGSPSPTGTRRR
jgi:crotonobetaine/carnitine-CoA ligase